MDHSLSVLPALSEFTVVVLLEESHETNLHKLGIVIDIAVSRHLAVQGRHPGSVEAWLDTIFDAFHGETYRDAAGVTACTHR